MIRRLFLALAFCALAAAAHATCTNSTNPIVPGLPGAPFTCDTGSTPKSTDIVQGGAVATGSTVGWTWGQIFSTFGTGTTPGGNPQTIQFNNFTAFGGDPTFTFNPTTKAVSIGGTLGIIGGGGTALTVAPLALVWNDTSLPRMFNAHAAWTGSSSNTQPTLLNRFQVNDQISYSGSQYVAGYNFEDDYGGATSTGGKTAMNVTMVQSLGANGDSGADNFYTGLSVGAFGRFTPPGSSSTTPLGRIFGFNSVGQIQPGFTATNYFQVASAEFDVNIPSGSSSFVRSGVTIASLTTGGVQGSGVDNALWLYGAGAKWRYGINFSDTQAWPIDDTVGTMIGAKYGGGRNSSPDMSAMWGIDLQQVAFPHTGNPYDGGFLRSNGMSFDGAGTLQLGTTYFTSGSSGLTIDAKGSVGTGATIGTAGSGYESGNIVVAAYGGLWSVATSGGVPTGAVTTLVEPVVSSLSPPSNPITPTNLNPASQGSGLTLTLTWNTTGTQLNLGTSAATAINLGNSSSTTTVTGNASIGGTLAAGVGSAGSLLFSGAAANPTIKAVGTNAGIQIFPTGTGEIFFGNGSGSSFFQLQLFGSASNLTDSLEILGTTTANVPLVIKTQSGFGINFATKLENALPTASTPQTIAGYMGLTTATFSSVPADTSQPLLQAANSTFASGFNGGVPIYATGNFNNIATGAIVYSVNSRYQDVNQQGQPGSPIVWSSGVSVTTGQLDQSGPRMYSATTTGTTGGSAPVCTSGTCSDGGVTWQYEDILAGYNTLTGDNSFTIASFNVGGAANAPMGALWGSLTGFLLQPGATFYNSATALEYDCQADTGSSVANLACTQIVKQGPVQGSGTDSGLIINGSGALGATGFRNPLVFRSATSSDGVLIAAVNFATGGTQNMAGAFDCLMCNPNGTNNTAGAYVSGGGGYILRTKGTQILGTGDVQVGYGDLHSSGSGLTIDTAYESLSATGSFNGDGANWTASEWAVDSVGNAGQVAVSGGVPTGWAASAAPWQTGRLTYQPSSGLPSGAVTFCPMNSSNVVGATGALIVPTCFSVASETYTAVTTMNLGPTAAAAINIGNSGSTTNVAGAIQAGGTAGVTCAAGIPSSSFTTKNGIVTHC